MPVVEISNREDLERWLKGKPREWAIIIAARATLRITPLLSTALPLRGFGMVGNNIILPVFRGMAVSWVAGIWPIHDEELRAAAAMAADVTASAAAAAARAPHYVAVATAATSEVDTIANATKAADEAVNAATRAAGQDTARASAWEQINIDAQALQEIANDSETINASATEKFLRKRLWQGGDPEWADRRWVDLKKALLSPDEDWEVWTDWYEARLHGSPAIESLELARAQTADEIWQQGPKVVNAHIRELIAKFEPLPIDPPFESIPSQVSDAFVFGGPDDAPITYVDPPGSGLNDTADQRQSHSDIREKAEQLEVHCGQSNRLAVLKGHALKLVAAAGETLLDLRLRAFWSQMNSLRRRYEAELRARSATDPDSPPLPEDVAGILQDLVENLNVFAAHEPKLAALDDVSRDPSQRVATEQTVQAARDIADAATNAPNAIQPDAASALNEAAAEAIGDTPSAERSKEFTTKSARNLVLEALRRAYKGALGEAGFAWKGAREGAYRFGGGIGASYGAAMFIKANEAAVRTLIDTLGGSSTLQHIVDLIIKILS